MKRPPQKWGGFLFPENQRRFNHSLTETEIFAIPKE